MPEQKHRSYSITPEFSNPESNPEMESSPNLDVPIIDLIRHAESDYKIQYGFLAQLEKEERPLTEKKFREMVRQGRGPQESELKPEGVEAIHESAHQLAGQIDTDSEVIYIVASPLSRTFETANIFAEALQKINPKIQIINAGEIHEAWSLKGITPKVMQIIDREIEDQGQLHKDEVPEINAWYRNQTNKDKAFDLLESDFYNFLRRAINYRDWLSQDSLDKIRGKKLRLIGFTHTEQPFRFIRDSFGPNPSADLKNTQILEIAPQSKLKQGVPTKLDIKIYPKDDSPVREQAVLFTYRPKEGVLQG